MCVFYNDIVLFFKQKKAYGRRVSDLSSDVCSSDLIPDSRRQSVVPEATVAHDRDCPLVPCLEGRGPRCSQTIAHGRIADVEGRQDRKEMAANVGRNVK